jgi:hypothetical protein
VKPIRQPRQSERDADELRVVFVPPATPEEANEAWQRWVEALDWLVGLGAMDG